MLAKTLAGALALAAAIGSGPAWADDPKDPAMRTKAAREKDAAEIRRLNQQELAAVQQRDAGYAVGWQATRDYPRQQADYEQKMAAWRKAVALCNSGHTEYCAP